MTQATVKLSKNDTVIAELPTYSATLGQDVIDVSALTTKDLFTYDPGFVSTASCESKITFIDGEKGILLYRGYPIEQLAEHCDYLDTCYLLLEGELPNASQKEAFSAAITERSAIPDELKSILQGFSQNAHPMAMLMALLSGLATINHEDIDITNAEQRKSIVIDLIAKISTLAAMCFKHNQGEAFVEPNPTLGYSANFLHMLFGTTQQEFSNNPALTQALDRIFILHADHEQNASTSTVRLTGSTGANPYACIAAGVAALWGPAHGGANEACLNMLREIGDSKNIAKYVEKAKDKNDPFRLMGFGHRVYKNYDPRAKVMRNSCHEVLAAVGAHDGPLFKIALELEKIALEDNYFIEKKLYPNVDFYSGITLSAIGIPSNMFTVLFALGRTVGWASQWNEMLSGNVRIGRPRQLYTGPVQRDLP